MNKYELVLANLEQNRPSCVPIYPYAKNNTAETFSFLYFVQHFMGPCHDDHWALQSSRMRPATWKFINFVGHLEDLREDAHRLLRRIGAFEKFGRDGWGPNQNASIFETNGAIHATLAHQKLEDYFGKDKGETERLVLEHYRSDYEHAIMNLSKPEGWERVMAA